MYDAIIVGARCGGSPTAMLLAQKGYSVLVLDRGTFPSDTPSTHIIKYPGVSQLAKWGLLDEVVESGCPPLREVRSNHGDFELSGRPPADTGVPMLAPRRKYLDDILVNAARKVGAEVREEFSVRKLLTEDGRVVGIEGQSQGGDTVTERARIVVGADGKQSMVARSVGAPMYDNHPPAAFYYYTYWSELPTEGLEIHWRHHRFVLAFPTHDDQTCVVVARPIAEFGQFSADAETGYHETLAIAPDLAAAVDGREPEEPYKGMAVPHYHRRPHGPGWALVGDAGLVLDPLNAHGISDAFCDAENLAHALDLGFSGTVPLADALAAYERERNARKEGHYERNWRGSHLEGWDTPTALAVRARIGEDSSQADRWAGTIAFSVDHDGFYGSPFVRDAMAGTA